MKNFLIFIISVSVLFSATGCGKRSDPTFGGDGDFTSSSGSVFPENGSQPGQTVPPVSDNPGEEVAPSDFYNKMQTDFRPIAVMIDNDEKSSRPQLGLETAYLIYEMVVEGSATRFMALFKDANMKKIGPVRSSRHYFLDYVMENDARYIHSGWSDRAASEIRNYGINNINGLYDNIFWRDRTYDNTWHNLYTGFDKAEALMKEKGYRETSDVKLFEYHKNPVKIQGNEASLLYMFYAPFYEVEFRYNPETTLYERYINGEPHKSQTGEILTAENIIVYDLLNVPLNDGIYAPRQNINTVGSGEGYYLSKGKAVKITWKKTSRKSPTEYTLQDGVKLILNPGQTYIQIVPSKENYKIS